jgi:hypothetical protein
VAYIDGVDSGYLVIYEYTGGAFNRLMNWTACPGDALKHLSAQKHGQTLSVYYGASDFGTKIGADVTINAAIAGNKNHGLFSLDSSIQFNGLFKVSNYSPFDVPTTVTPINLVYGGTSITNLSGGYREMTSAWLQGTYSLTTFVITNSSQSGHTSWNNLFRMSTDFLAHTPDLVFFEDANDGAGGFSRSCVEAFIRRIWTNYPNCKFIFTKVFAVTDRTVDANINTPTTAAMTAEFVALANYYGITMLNYWDRIADLVNNHSRHLSDFMIDNVHPSSAGFAEIEKLAEPVLTPAFLASKQSPASLPARLYDNGDYENAAVIKNGTAYDSKAGTWTTTGNQISSSEAGATVTYSATCQSIGRPESDGVYTISIDGGAERSIVFNYNGASGFELTTRAAHTVRITVVSGTVTISQFWAI